MAQPGVTPADRAAINVKVVALFGSSYEAGDIVNVDSVKGSLSYAEGRFQDPSGLLQHCLIFTAHNKQGANYNKCAVGVYKNLQVVWNSDTAIVTDGFSFDALFGTYDLMGDGKIEIMLEWPEGDRTSTMWIYKWDGTTGTRINALDGSGHSTIVEYESFDFADVDGDGVWEIQANSGGRGSPDQPYIWSLITYKWNGQYYDTWSAAPQYTDSTFYPRDKVDVDVKANVAQVQGLYRYRYRVQNRPTSIQKVNEIIITKHTDNLTALSGRQSWDGYNGKGKAHWNNFGPLSGSYLYPTANYISQGETDSSFGFDTPALPSISNYYILGYNKAPIGSDLRSYYQNAYVNSKTGKTIAPTDPPAPFNKFNFIDTIKSYINQSRSLGWIADSVTKYKYLNFMDSAKAQLQRNDNRTGRTTLDSVTANCQRDSGSVLTSEAYALIFFNGKYLLAQLPVPPPQYQLNVTVAGGGTVTISPDTTVYDSATTVTLTASAFVKNRFAGWSGDTVSSTNPITITMNRTKSITATFIHTYSITVQTNPAGRTDSVDGVAYTSAHTFTWDSASTHRIATITPQNGTTGVRYLFLNWSDGLSMGHTITASFSGTYTANFKTQYQVTVQTNPASRTFSVDGTSYTAAQTPWWDAGANHTIATTTPQNGTPTGTIYDYLSWSDGGALSHTVAPSAPLTYTANFATRYLLTVTASPSSGGSTTPSSPTYFFRGQTVTVSAIPNCNTYHFSSWTGDTSSTNSAFNVTMYAPKTYTANFVTPGAGYTLILNTTGVGSATASPALSCYPSGSWVTLTAHPGQGYQFIGWSGDTSGTAFVVNVLMTKNKSITANFTGVVPQSPIKK